MLLIPTAKAMIKDILNKFFTKLFNSIDCITSHKVFFKRTIDLKSHILDQDIIYVGGGNTKRCFSME